MCFMATPVLASEGSQSVYMEELTWQEIKGKLRSGTQSVIVPSGGIEQGGPQLVTGKQNTIIHYTAGQIARSVNALVAPVIAYVPEGRIEPPEGHMQFPGTISVTEQTYASILQDTAASLKQQGFRYIFFIGEHGGSQRVQQQVADKLTSMWLSEGVRVYNVSHYFSRAGQEEWNESAGLKIPSPQAHAGHIETSEMMALDPSGVRDNLRAAYMERDYKATGAMGDSTKASAKYGRRYIGLKQEAAIKQIRHAISVNE
jgi:creatinine amidohydrolase/Fe(II)-dependent formamide hydrolase-like protein